MNNKQTYWNSLLEQYRKGIISQSDRFLLEKRALDDPFLMDALEGYSGVQADHSAMIEEIRCEITPKKKQRRFLYTSLSVAASLLIFLGITFIVKQNTTGISNELLSDITDTSAMFVMNEVQPERVNVKPKNKTTTTPTTTSKSHKPEKVEKKGAQDTHKPRVFQDEVIEEESTKVQRIKSREIAALKKKLKGLEREREDDYEVPKIIINGQITDIYGVPLPGVEIVEVGTKNFVETNAFGVYNIIINYDDAIIEPNFEGYVMAEINTDLGSRMDFKMKQEEKGSDNASYGSLPERRTDMKESKSIRKNIDNTKERWLSGVIVDEAGDPVFGAIVSEKDGSSNTISNFDGYYELVVNKKSSRIIVASPIYKTVNFGIPSDSIFNLILTEKEIIPEKILYNTTPATREREINAYPAIGYERLNRMIRDKLHSIDLLQDKKGEIEIGFSINSLGQLSDFSVQKSLSEKLDDEVIHILKSSGKWLTIPKIRRLKTAFSFQY